MRLLDSAGTRLLPSVKAEGDFFEGAPSRRCTKILPLDTQPFACVASFQLAQRLSNQLTRSHSYEKLPAPTPTPPPQLLRPSTLATRIRGILNTQLGSTRR